MRQRGLVVPRQKRNSRQGFVLRRLRLPSPHTVGPASPRPGWSEQHPCRCKRGLPELYNGAETFCGVRHVRERRNCALPTHPYKHGHTEATYGVHSLQGGPDGTENPAVFDRLNQFSRCSLIHAKIHCLLYILKPRNKVHFPQQVHLFTHLIYNRCSSYSGVWQYFLSPMSARSCKTKTISLKVEVSSYSSKPAAPSIRAEQAQSTAVSIAFIMLTTLPWSMHSVQRCKRGQGSG